MMIFSLSQSEDHQLMENMSHIILLIQKNLKNKL